MFQFKIACKNSDEEEGRWVAPRSVWLLSAGPTRAPGTRYRAAYLGLTPAGRRVGVGKQGR